MVRTLICCCLVVFVLIWGTESRPGGQPCSLRMNPSRGVINVRSGTAVSFVCSATCLGPLSRGQLVWRDPDENLVPQMGRHRIQSVNYNQFRVSRLLVHRAFPEDSGVYSCEILHGGKRLRYTASLQVAENSDSRPDDGPRRGDIYIEPEPDFGDIRPAREASRDPARHYRSRQRQAGRMRRSLSGGEATERGDGEDSRAIIPLTAGEKEEENEGARDVGKVEATVPETVAVRVGDRREIRKLAARVRREANNQSVPGLYNDTTTEFPSDDSIMPFGNLTVTTDPADGTSFVTTEETAALRNVSDQNETTRGNVTDLFPSPTTTSSKTPPTSAGKDGGLIPDKDSPKPGLTTATTPDTTSTSASTTTSTTTTSTTTTTTSTTTTSTTTTTTPSPRTTGSTTTGSEKTGKLKGGEEDGETDFGRYGGVAFGLAMVVIILLVVAILLYFLLPRCCKNKNLFIFNRESKDRDDHTGSVPSQNNKDSNVILLGERPHKPVAPMASATGLNGEFITPVDLDTKEEQDEDEDEDDEDEEGQDQGQRERGSPEGQKAEGEQPGDKPKESYVSTFLIGRLSSSKASDEDRAVVAGNTGPLEDSVFAPASSTPLIPEKKGTKPEGEDTSSSSSEDEDEEEEDAASSSPENSKDPAKRTSGGAQGRASSGSATGQIHLQIDPASGITVENSHTDV